MDIGIIDADLIDNGTNFPNLALMKISGYQKELSNNVTLLDNYDNIHKYDEVYISKVFTKTNVPSNILSSNYKNKSLSMFNKNAKNTKIYYGGTGFDLYNAENLSDIIEHHFPDYSLYMDYIDNRLKNSDIKNKYELYKKASIGFTTRGCFRKCDFCVNKKYDKVFRHSKIKEFYDSTRPHIILLDDNILGYEKWEEVFDELESTKKPFQFKQGMDLRLMTDEKAERLSSVKYHGDFMFSFDFYKDHEFIEKKLLLWRKYNNKTTKIYCLCAFESQDIVDIENLFKRILILMKYNCLTYVMKYEKFKNSKYEYLYTAIAGWCNQPHVYKKMSFREYCTRRNNKKEIKAFYDFEKEYPDIANKYYDIKFTSFN
jgi:hypothetical protein